MRYIALFASAFAITVATTAAAKADTPLDVLGVEKCINDVSRRAQETGDHIAQAFADAALKAIAE